MYQHIYSLIIRTPVKPIYETTSRRVSSVDLYLSGGLAAWPPFHLVTA